MSTSERSHGTSCAPINLSPFTSMTTPLTVGLIQESVTANAAANLEHAVTRIREAAGRGAQIICLQELFNSPYFCKAEKCDRFDLAEAIPGPTVERMQSLAKELEVVLVVPIFERQEIGRASCRERV